MTESAFILQPVRAHAIVDSAGTPEGAAPEWRVKVWDDHLGQVRFYEIAANTESEAAMEGLRRFREEMEAAMEALRRFREEMEAPLAPTNEEGV